ncbi:MAG TPA: hypothetical protein VHB99_08530, partial [Pirellulales bacterium]|nr:hypothetical protein [Pirellulales bacterium]
DLLAAKTLARIPVIPVRFEISGVRLAKMAAMSQPLQFRLRTLFWLTAAVAALCTVLPRLLREFEPFRRFIGENGWVFLPAAALLAFHIGRVLFALRRFRNSGL